MSIWVKSQEGSPIAAIRETEDFRQKLQKQIDAIVKVYSDKVQYEKAFAPQDALNKAKEHLDVFNGSLDVAMDEIKNSIRAYGEVKLDAFSKAFGLSGAQEELPLKGGTPDVG